MRKFLISIICALCVCSAFAAGENVATSKAFVDTAVAQKQDKIPANTNPNNSPDQVLTNTGTAGNVGTKDIYTASGEYANQMDSLVTAGDMNAAVQTAIETEFKCIKWVDDDPTKDCLLVDILGATRAQQPYVSATGTVAQNGTPTPEHPVEPVFYRQGDMILRRVGDYADSYDANTRQITRRVGVLVLKGTESWVLSSSYSSVYPTFWLVPAVNDNASISADKPAIVLCPYFASAPVSAAGAAQYAINHMTNNTVSIGSTMHTAHTLWMRTNLYSTVADFKAFLAARYAAGAPVTVYYPLATPVIENWDATTYNQYMPSNE